MCKFFAKHRPLVINLPRAERNCAIGQRLCRRRRSQSGGTRRASPSVPKRAEICIIKRRRWLANQLQWEEVCPSGSRPSLELGDELNGASGRPASRRWMKKTKALPAYLGGCCILAAREFTSCQSGERKFAAAWPWLQESWCVYVFLKAILVPSVASWRRPSIHPSVRLDSLGAGSRSDGPTSTRLLLLGSHNQWSVPFSEHTRSK